ncbi:MAG: hypothetical protein IKH77_02005 [Clostridia bacterium]|nr:hypothetical protein [Clostridia bacterium]
MLFKTINFDEHFAEFVSQWYEAHRGDYRNFDAMEADMPRVYTRFLNTPAPWLEGITPGAYFTQFEDPKDLVDWLCTYCENGVPVPDLLLEQIENVGKPCEKRLVALLRSEGAPAEARMIAVTLLRSMESTQPKMLYISWQLNREEEDELADNAIDALKDMGRSAIQPMLEALPKATPAGQAALLDVLVNYPGYEPVYQTAIRLFRSRPEQRALFAGYLAKLGDERALPDLVRAAEDGATGYVDWIELRSAIERLGGTVSDRDFSDDPDYEALQGTDPM